MIVSSWWLVIKASLVLFSSLLLFCEKDPMRFVNLRIMCNRGYYILVCLHICYQLVLLICSNTSIIVLHRPIFHFLMGSWFICLLLASCSCPFSFFNVLTMVDTKDHKTYYKICKPSIQTLFKRVLCGIRFDLLTYKKRDSLNQMRKCLLYFPVLFSV